MNLKNKIIGVSVLILLIILISFNIRNTSPTVKIAGLLPLTGGLASYGEPAKMVSDLAVEEINKSGGINGKKLEIVYEDHKCDPKAAVTSFEKVISVDKINIAFMVACSGTVTAIAPNLETKNIAVVGTVTSANKLSGISPNFFRNWASDGLESKLLAEYIVDKGYKSVAVIYEDTDYAKGLKISLEDYLKNSDVKIYGESFTSGSTDVRTQLAKIQSNKPDVIFISVQTVTSGELVLTQMENLNLKFPLLVSDNIIKSSSIIANHKSILEGAIGGDYVFIKTDKLDSIMKAYKDKYGADCPQINICAAQYDAIQLIAGALKEKGNSAKDVIKYLKVLQYQGASGDVSFDSKNDRDNANYSLFEIKDGEVVVIGK